MLRLVRGSVTNCCDLLRVRLPRIPIPRTWVNRDKRLALGSAGLGQKRSVLSFLARQAAVYPATVEVVQTLLVVRSGRAIGCRIYGIRLAEGVVQLERVLCEVVVLHSPLPIACVDPSSHAQHVPLVGHEGPALPLAKDSGAGPGDGRILGQP